MLKVEKGKDGRLQASLASPDQGAARISISSIDLKNGELTFESKVIGARYVGKKLKDGTGFEGTFFQGAMKMPLILKKTEKITELSRPQTPRSRRSRIGRKRSSMRTRPVA